MFEHEKTAALNPSAPTDGGQLSQKITTSIIPDDSMKSNPLTEKPCTEIPSTEMELLRRLEQSQDANYLPMMSLDTLMEKTFPVQEGVIEHLLYKGLYIFAGAPKIGKSFLVLQLAYAISTGQAFCGYEVKRGAVLYLALEDQYQRLQRRMARMFGVEGQGDLLLAVSAKPIGQGLEGQMEFFLKQYPQARLIVIDTLQKVREGGLIGSLFLVYLSKRNLVLSGVSCYNTNNRIHLGGFLLWQRATPVILALRSKFGMLPAYCGEIWMHRNTSLWFWV